MIGNTVSFSSKQLFISAPQNYCIKSIGKFPKKVAHASFLQCSTYIVLGQDDDLGKINLKMLWNHGTKNQVKHGKYGSVMPPIIYPRKPLFLGLTLRDKTTTPPSPEIYPQNFSAQYLVVWSSKKQQRRWWD